MIAAPEPSQTEVWCEVLAQDAQAVALLLRGTGVDKALRQHGRQLLFQTGIWLQPLEQQNDTPEQPEPDPQKLLGLLLQLQLLRHDLGDDRGHGAWPIGKLWIRKPLWQWIEPMPSSRQTDALCAAIAQRFRTVVALSPARMAWFEARCAQQDPTRIAMVRAPKSDQSSRDSLELLVRAGKSKFS